MSDVLMGRVALVTGGASGIGRATAILLANAGARVLVCDLNESGAEQTADHIRANSGEARHQQVDIANEDSVTRMVEYCITEFDGLDCAVNNAGVGGPTCSLDQIGLEDFNHVLGINLTGTFLCMKHELRFMLPRSKGSIVNMASGAGMIATPGLAAYCASKHAVLGITRTAAVEYARTGIRINAVCPGSTDTPMVQRAMEADSRIGRMITESMPIGRLGRPEEVAEAVLWLCSDAASLVTGHSMLVDGASVAR
ncbi:MAG: glucose 1-dehydrogenase [Myxococcota bacterium]